MSKHLYEKSCILKSSNPGDFDAISKHMGNVNLHSTGMVNVGKEDVNDIEEPKKRRLGKFS